MVGWPWFLEMGMTLSTKRLVSFLKSNLQRNISSELLSSK